MQGAVSAAPNCLFRGSFAGGLISAYVGLVRRCNVTVSQADAVFKVPSCCIWIASIRCKQATLYAAVG